MSANSALSPRQRVELALQHQEPDRAPVDFLATPEIWDNLIQYFPREQRINSGSDYFSPQREDILQRLEVDCRVISYDMFCAPPESTLQPGCIVDWWSSMSRSTPNRMWRLLHPDGSLYDIWGRHFRSVRNPVGAYEEIASFPLSTCSTVGDLKAFQWPKANWWDFQPLPDVLSAIEDEGSYHVRFRAGTIFELAWQLRGMEAFMIDLASDPDLAIYILERITETTLDYTRRALEIAGDRIDMVYFYDDLGSNNSLLVSKAMWRRYIRPYHQKMIDLAKSFGKKIMYHTDGAVSSLIPELIDMGVDVLDPIQPTAKDMAPETLKARYGDRLCFHGGIDIIHTLRTGAPSDVEAEVRNRVRVMGQQGGYILCSSHHIQPDTPLENIISLYQTSLRYRA